MKHRIRVEQLSESLYVPGVPQLRRAAHNLYVLFRHRPRSIPPQTGGRGSIVNLPRTRTVALFRARVG